jgi:flagellar protein FliS
MTSSERGFIGTAGRSDIGAAYRDGSLSTAPPERLLVMLYERLALDLVRAEESLEAGAGAGGHLVHAQDVVLELLGSLDVSAWTGGPALSGIYAFLHRELVQANIGSDVDRVRACRSLVEPLRDAWRDAAVMAARPRGAVDASAAGGRMSAIV